MGVTHRQVSLFLQGMIAEAVAGEILVYLPVIPVDNGQQLEDATLDRQHRQVGAAAGLLAPQTRKPGPSVASARFIGSTLLSWL